VDSSPGPEFGPSPPGPVTGPAGVRPALAAGRVALAVAFVAFHATLLLTTAAQRQLLPAGTIAAEVLRDYAAISGADNTFSFFAPHVASQAFTEVTSAGPGIPTEVHRYERGGTEGELRIISLSLAMQQQGLYDLLAYALAEHASRRPGVESVQVRLGYYRTSRLTEPLAAPEPAILYQGRYLTDEDPAR